MNRFGEVGVGLLAAAAVGIPGGFGVKKLDEAFLVTNVTANEPELREVQQTGHDREEAIADQLGAAGGLALAGGVYALYDRRRRRDELED